MKEVEAKRLYQGGKTMRKKNQLEIPKEKIEAFCRKHHIRKLSLFGSVLRVDFGPESDVSKEKGRTPKHTGMTERYPC